MKRFSSVLILLCAINSACVYSPDNSNVDMNKAHDSAIAASIGYLKAEKLERAAHHAESALDYNPKSPQAYHVLALIYQKQKDYGRAEQQFKKALSFDSNFSQARNNYGLFLIERKRYQDAINQLSLSANDFNYPNRASSFSSIGNAYEEMGNKIQSVANWDKALNINNQLPLPAYKLAKFYLNQSNYYKASDYYKVFEMFGQQTEETAFVGLEIAIGANDKSSINHYEKLWRSLKMR